LAVRRAEPRRTGRTGGPRRRGSHGNGGVRDARRALPAGVPPRAAPGRRARPRGRVGAAAGVAVGGGGLLPLDRLGTRRRGLPWPAARDGRTGAATAPWQRP